MQFILKDVLIDDSGPLLAWLDRAGALTPSLSCTQGSSCPLRAWFDCDRPRVEVDRVGPDAGRTPWFRSTEFVRFVSPGVDAASKLQARHRGRDSKKNAMARANGLALRSNPKRFRRLEAPGVHAPVAAFELAVVRERLTRPGSGHAFFRAP